MTYLLDETSVTIERINELDRFELRGRSKELWIQTDAEFFLGKVTGNKPGVWSRVAAATGDILISSGEKLRAWSST